MWTFTIIIHFELQNASKIFHHGAYGLEINYFGVDVRLDRLLEPVKMKL